MNGKITYRQQFTRCGKQRCRKCREGAGHGPYWYAYWSDKGRTVSKYIGLTLPEEVETALQLGGPEKGEPSAPVPSTPVPTIRIYLLGQFRIEHLDAGTWRTMDSRTWHRRRARALLGCLLSSSGRRLGREQIMELLWPDLEIDVAANRLNGAVHELRQILEPDITRPAASRMLRLERDVLELADSTQIWVDAEEFESLLKAAETAIDAEQTEQILESASTLYRGSYLLEELYSEWATQRRDALQRAWIGLLLKQADVRAEKGAFVSAIETLDRLRTADPTNETALQRLMLLLTQRDRRGEALQIYRQHVALLQRDYEGEPLPETIKLYEALRKGQFPTVYTQTFVAEPPVEKTAPLPPTPDPKTPASDISFTRPLFQLGRHNQSPLIGRDHELDLMQRLVLTIEELKAGQSPASVDNVEAHIPPSSASSSSRPRHTHFLLLKGEAGIGKTRLAEELSLEAYHRGWTVAWSRSYEQERTIPYRPWTELLRTLLHSSSTFTELVNMAASSSASSSPTQPLKIERLSALLPEMSTPASRSASPVPPEQERLHLWEAALGLLEAFSAFHPLLLVLDDLHWADDSSIELLTYLTHHLQDQPVLLVGTCRDGELVPLHKLRALTADLQREQAIAVINVLPLTQSQIGALLSHLPQNVIQSIQTQASGNPFFAEELARYVGALYNEDDPLVPLTLDKQASPRQPRKPPAETQRMVGGDLIRGTRSLPEAISTVLERRLSKLSNGCQLLLSKAAVLGGSFELSQLMPMANENNEDVVLDLLEEALQSGLLTEEGAGAHITYHFWHPLIINHLYGRLSAARRAQLHRRAAEALKAANAAQPEKAAAAIFHHLNRGGSEAMLIADYAELAGNHAHSLAAHSEAQQYYLHAIQALIDNGLPPVEGSKVQDTHATIEQLTARTLAHLPIAEPLRVCRLLERVAECSNIQGNFQEARNLYECEFTLRTSERFQRLVYIASAASAEKYRQEAQIQGLILREIGITWSAIGEYDKAYAFYRRGKEVMARVGVTSGAAWACLHMQYGATLRIEGNYYEARRYLQEALKILEQVVQQRLARSQAGEESAQSTSAIAPTEITNASRALLTRTERALLGDPLEIGYAHERLGIVAASLGQLNDALKHLHTALTIYEQSDLISVMGRVCGNLGGVYITKGEHTAARNYLHRSLNLAERAGNLPTKAFVMHNLGDLTQRSGDLLEAEGWFKQAMTISERLNDREHINWACVALAAVQVDLGKLREAASNLHRALMIGREIKSTRCICYALVGLADLRIVQALAIDVNYASIVNGQEPALQRRRWLLRAKATLKRVIALEGMEVENIIDGKHLLALVHYLLHDLEEAQQMALQTLQEAQAHETTRIIGRAYRLLGRILIVQGHAEQAEHYFQQALQVCAERELRLDYARTLHGYGIALLQRQLSAPTGDLSHPTTSSSKSTKSSKKGLDYLHEARAIFADCHSRIDLAFVEQALAEYATAKAI